MGMRKEMDCTADSPERSTLHFHGEKDIDHSNSGITTLNDDRQSLSEDKYPHGTKLLLLAGASVVSVFLIALDQVRLLFLCYISTDRGHTDYRWHSNTENHR